ncbi:MAG: carboxylating nicotinate-nucleotide diphosphorylase [Gammaproteobacteria bacterium]
MATLAPSWESIDECVLRALREDVGRGDLTAQLLPADANSSASVLCREAAVLCGTLWFERVFYHLDQRVKIRWYAADGEQIEPKQCLCRIKGPTRALLTGERTALNFLQCLSGTASITRAYARAISGTAATLLDTRKTLPGLRLAQKYAVRCGGGENHRSGLFDAILIKENHIIAAGSIGAALANARHAHPEVKIEIEVEDLEQLKQALEAGAEFVLLDNFTLEGLRAAVEMAKGKARLEASGGFDLACIRQAAETGVDYVSVGALTKNARAVDLSLRFAS